MSRYTLSPHRRQGRFFGRLLIFLCIIALPLYAIYNFQLYPGISELAKTAAQNRIQSLIATAFLTEFTEDYDDLILITYRTDGGISGISCRMANLNRARNRLFLSVLRGLSQGEGVEVSLPLGNLLGGEAFSGRGPSIPIRILLAEGGGAYMESEFRTAGINQTLHRILFTVTVDLTVLTPSRPLSMQVRQSFAVAETVIVGEVPDAFTQVNRLTDDVTEEELDDMNDYGAAL